MKRTRLFSILWLCALALSPGAHGGLADGLTAYWKFDEASGITALDASTNVYPAKRANTASLYGPQRAPGFLGTALSLNGTSDYAVAGLNMPSELNTMRALTYAAWVNTRTASGFICDGRKPFWIYGTQLRFTASYSTLDLHKNSVDNAVPSNQWVHVAVTWDGTTNASGVHLYRNGVEVSYSASTDGAGTLADSSAFYLGRCTSPSAPSHYLNGYLDEMAVWNRALSASEVSALSGNYATGIAIPLSPINSAPDIFGCSNLTVVLPNSAVLSCLVTDDGLPTGAQVANSWSKVSGPGTVTFSDASSPITRASFSAAGSYTLLVTAWDGLLTNYATCAVEVYASPLNLRVMFSGTGTGAVRETGISNRANCTLRFSTPTTVSLTAEADSGSTFLGWVGTGYTGTNNPCTVTMDSAKEITAFFDTTGTATGTYYVATNGNDTNPGTPAAPWRTIQRAVTNATPGTKIIVKAGEYNEFVSARNSGTAANPIVFEGERGPQGEWLTIIDPSTPITNGWVQAPEIGPGTWKKTGLPFDPKEMTIDNKRVALVYTLGSLASQSLSIYAELTNGSQLFGVASNGLVTTAGTTIRFWDGLEAIYATSSNTTYTCYLRFRNGESPNGKNVRVAPDYDGYPVMAQVHRPAVDLKSYSYLVFRNFLIRGAYACIKIGVTEYYAADHNIVENNYLSGGLSRVYVTGGLTGNRSSYNIIRNNDIVSGYYGYDDGGAWGGGVGYRYVIRRYMYETSKYTMGHYDTWDEAIYMTYSGDGNIISGNHIYHGFGGQGINFITYAPPASKDVVISDNIIENHPSTGMVLQPWTENLRVHDNLISDCNANIRFGELNYAGETNRSVYIYQNKSRLPDGVGDHCFFHFENTYRSSFFPTIWIYNNSFSGGATCFEWNGNTVAAGGTPNLRMLNNILSTQSPYQWFPNDFATNSSFVGGFDYNLLKTWTPTHPAWWGTHNIEQPKYEWTNCPVMTFGLTPGSAALGHGVDVSQTFILNGNNFPALPQTSGRSTGRDMGACLRLQPPLNLTVVGTPP